MSQFKIEYFIGTTSRTQEFHKQDNLQFLNKQFQLSIPLITGARVIYQENKKEFSKKIYVGKEISLKDYRKDKYLLEKFDISMAELADVATLGYERACLLNFKKYDQVLIGVLEDDLIVPDYYALKNVLSDI